MSSYKVEEETDCMSEYTSPGLNIIEITYPKDIDKDGKIEFKDQTIRNHPETLFADKNSKGRITNLLFSTEKPEKWLEVFCGHYKFHSTDRKRVAMKLQIRKEEEDPIWLTIHIYDIGKVLLQGTEERLRDFAKIFMNLKEKASSEDVTDVSATVQSDNHRGKITSFFHKNGSKCLSKTDKSQEDNTGNQKEEGANKQEEENIFTEDELNGRQQQRDCAGNEEGEKNNVKKEEKASNKSETI